MPQVISLREHPEHLQAAITYIQKAWPEVRPVMYEDSLTHSLTALGPLPQWHLLQKDDVLIGCAGLITNDFISRMDLWPWLCALYVDPNHRGHAYASILMDQARNDCARHGFEHLYLSTDHIGFYERYGFRYLAQGYHPWGEESRIYVAETGPREPGR